MGQQQSGAVAPVDGYHGRLLSWQMEARLRQIGILCFHLESELRINP
jgi:hypothetical protein